MEDWQQRLMIELYELDKKLKALNKFIADDKFGDMSSIDKHLLVSQAHVMTEYANILEQRCARFGGKLDDGTRWKAIQEHNA